MKTLENRTIANPTKEKALFGLAFAGLLGLFAPVLIHLYTQWSFDPYYTHGPIVPLVSIFFAWSLRKDAARLSESRRRHPLYPLVFGIGLYLAAYLIDLRFGMYIAFIISLGGLVLFLWGPGVLRAFHFPLLYLLLMLPLPYVITSSLAFPLQLMSSKYAALLLDILGISALQEGVNLHIPGYSFIIERGCSGLHSIIALFSLSVLFAHVIDVSNRKKVFLVFSALPIALVANLTRIVVVILVAQTWGRETAESFFHTFSSLFLFAFAFLLLVGTARYIGCLQPRK